MSPVNNDFLTQNKNKDSALHLAVDVDDGPEVTRLLDDAEKFVCLKEFLSLKDGSGNTALGFGLFAGKKKAIKAIITKIATNSDLLQEALSASNIYGETVLAIIIAQDDPAVFGYMAREASVNGLRDQLFSLVDAKGKNVTQLVDQYSANKIQAYIEHDKGAKQSWAINKESLSFVALSQISVSIAIGILTKSKSFGVVAFLASLGDIILTKANHYNGELNSAQQNDLKAIETKLSLGVGEIANQYLSAVSPLNLTALARNHSFTANKAIIDAGQNISWDLACEASGTRTILKTLAQGRAGYLGKFASLYSNAKNYQLLENPTCEYFKAQPNANPAKVYFSSFKSEGRAVGLWGDAEYSKAMSVWKCMNYTHDVYPPHIAQMLANHKNNETTLHGLAAEVGSRLVGNNITDNLQACLNDKAIGTAASSTFSWNNLYNGFTGMSTEGLKETSTLVRAGLALVAVLTLPVSASAYAVTALVADDYFKGSDYVLDSLVGQVKSTDSMPGQ